MRFITAFSLAALLLTPVAAQDKGDQEAKYENAELGLSFTGVYGWKRQVATGSAAWTELARYSEAAFDADVILLVRDNPYSALSDLRRAMQEEFKAGSANIKPGESSYREPTFRDEQMRAGLQLPAIEVECKLARITKEGKKRELAVLSRTYYGANRLFRVHCTARSSRLKRVKDLFQRAAKGLVVSSSQEKVVSGYRFHSERGKYQCLVPAELTGALPPRNAKADMRFGSRNLGVTISIWSYAFDGILADHVEEMVDYYGTAIKVDNEEAKALGGTAFLSTLTKGDKVTLITGTVQNGRVYRIHTSGKKSKLDDLKRVHAAFAKTFKIVK